MFPRDPKRQRLNSELDTDAEPLDPVGSRFAVDVGGWDAPKFAGKGRARNDRRPIGACFEAFEFLTYDEYRQCVGDERFELEKMDDEVMNDEILGGCPGCTEEKTEI